MKTIIESQPGEQENFHGLSPEFGAPNQAMGLHDEIRELFSRVAKDRFPNPNRMAQETGVEQGSLSRFLNGKGSMRLDMAAKVLDQLGVKLSLPGEFPVDTTRQVLFADAKVVSVNGSVPPPNSESYLAVPLVGEAGAGPGMISKDEIESWVLVYRHHKSVQRRSNLIAVEIGKNQLSMVPTLHPGDIVLVDRESFEPSSYRELFLVRDPGQDGGGGKVKRVTLNGRGASTIITFSSDNTDGGFQPDSRPLSDYEGGLREAIIGKCVWGWTDLSGK